MPPTVMSPERRRLLDLLLAEQGVARTRPRVESHPGDRSAMPVSLMQQRIWFFDRLQPNSTIYNVAGAARLRGPVDVDALGRSLTEVVRRHEVLRTTFRQLDGRAVQQVNEAPELKLEVVDLRHLPEADRQEAAAEYCRGEVGRPFSLERDLMLRPRLLRTGEQEYLLVLVQHHIATDGWSINLLLREIGALYGAFTRGEPSPLPELTVHYGDFAAWQREHLSGDVLAEKLAYWKEQLTGAGLLDLPWTGRPRPAALSWNGDALSFALPPALVRRIRELADSERATPYMVLLAALSVVLTRWSGADETVIGCPIANRTMSELEGLMGCFVNTLPLRVSTAGDPSFRSLLRTAREVAHGGYEHQEVPFELMVEAVNPERDASSHVPLIRHQLGLHNEPRWSVELSGVTFEVETLSTETVRFDMEIDLAVDADGGISGPVYFSTDLFTPELVQDVLDAFDRVLRAALDAPDTPIALLPLAVPTPLAPAPVTDPATSARTVHGLVEGYAAGTPEAEALVHGEERWSYRELDLRAGRIAHHLRSLGVQPGDRVAVHLPGSGALAASALGVLKAGAVLVPLDPAHPRAAVRSALRDSGARIVLTESGSWHPGLLWAGAGVQVVHLDRIADQLAEAPAGEIPAGTAGRGAFALYAADGGPAGVHCHRSALERLRWEQTQLACTAADSVLLGGPVGLDTSPWRWLLPLVTGGRLVIAGGGATGAETAELMAREQVGVAHLVPAALAGLLAAPGAAVGLGGLRELAVVTDETWPALLEDARRLLPSTRLRELRGSAAAGADRLVVSRPAAGQGQGAEHGPLCVDPDVVVLDGRGQAVPVGVPGELHLQVSAAAGDAAARADDEGADGAETGGAGPETVLFGGVPVRRTGERGRRLPDGTIELLGRTDRALRIRRRLVETTEVQGSLARHEAVDRALVVADHEAPGGTELLGYLTLRERASGVRANAPELVKRARWRKIFEETYSGRGAEDDPTVNTAGWKSRSTDEYLSPEEMREWADGTMRRITALHPSRVLEVGCRNGQLLFRLAMRCDSYVATDLSARALAHIREHEQWLASKAEAVVLLERAADDFSELADGDFDTVVINSLAQYFPEADYLERVLADAVRVVRPGGTVYVGDVRSLGLVEALHLSVQARRLPPNAPVDRLRQAVTQHTEREEDLILDPRLFREIAGRIPGVTGVSLLPRVGRHQNELNAFRYDVLLRVGGEPVEVPAVEPADWAQDGLTPADLRETLTERRPETVLLRAVKDARTAQYAAGVGLLGSGLVDTVADLLDAARPVLGEPGSPVDHAELLALAAEAGYTPLIGCSANGVPGDLDVVLARQSDGEPVPFERLAAVLEQEWGKDSGAGAVLANDPLRAMRIKAVLPEIQQELAGRHPGYAVPAELIVVREWPLRADGTVDPAKLPAADRAAREQAKISRDPSTETERVIAEIWADALGLDRIGVTDDFFSLGGHSLMGAEVVERVRAVYEVELPLGTLFEAPTVASSAEYVDGQLAATGQGGAGSAPIGRVDRDGYRRKREERAGAGRAGRRGAGS
ncbi:condensation domain-containing protein [Kitasatospora sp. NPDC096147]|uniref:condensation domain-containing protein n=1 Tax=Kitasatospora sp. NPDC096147 TaxID=3364093 RepID=UPI003808B92A